jgi:endonuclease III
MYSISKMLEPAPTPFLETRDQIEDAIVRAIGYLTPKKKNSVTRITEAIARHTMGDLPAAHAALLALVTAGKVNLCAGLLHTSGDSPGP